MADEYADTKYLNLAIPSVVKGSDGKDKTVYLDIDTGQELKDLSGYTIYNGTDYYDPDKTTTDTNKDGKLDPDEVSVGVATLPNGKTNDHGMTDPSGGPKGTASNNFNYQHKPGYLGAVGTVAGMVNPFAGAAVGLVGKAMNVNNMDAVNSARKGLGLTPLSGKQQLKGAMKDNKGQIGNVNIGDKKYSVGFEALSPDGKTNLTYNEAKTRSALARASVTETPKDEVTAAPVDKAPSLMTKLTGLDKGFARKAFGIKPKAEETVTPTTPKAETKSLATRVTGLEKGWLSKALTGLTTTGKVVPEVAEKLPNYAPTPTPRPSVQASVVPTTPSITATRTPSQEASIGLPQSTASSLISHPNNPASTPNPSAGILGGAKPDRLGRVGLMSVNFDKMGLQPAMAAQMKSYQAAAVQAGIADKLSVDVKNAVRTQDQQNAIKASGKSWTNNSYHQIGLAVDVSPTAINEKDQITDQDTLDKSRQIAQNLGLGLLNPAKDPAHVEAHVPGQTAASLKNREIDPTTGLAKLSPSEDLGVRNNSVPTPSARPSSPSISTPTSLDKSFDSQVGMNRAQPTNEFDSMKNSMKPSTPSYSTVSDVKAPDTPAGLAAMGFTNRTPAEKAQIARTIAGELGQTSLAALRGNDPVAAAKAKAEVGSIIATMENRAATTKYAGSIAATQTPSQYNSLMSTNAAVTNQNFANNPAVAKSVDNFYAGPQADVNYGATNYHATAMSHPPGWSGAMTDTTQTGQHTFGHLGGFSPSADSQRAMNAFGTMAGTNYSPGKMKDDTFGYKGPSNPSIYGGAGFTPGGMNSPSTSVGSSSISTGLGRSTSSSGYSGTNSGAGFSPGGMNSPSGSTGSSRTGGTGGFAGGSATGSTSNAGGSNAGGSTGRSGSAGGSSAAGGSSKTNGGATGGAGGNNGKSNNGGHNAD